MNTIKAVKLAKWDWRDLMRSAGLRNPQVPHSWVPKSQMKNNGICAGLLLANALQMRNS
jgi:hypothetical protein